MIAYAARRFLVAIPTLFIIISIAFFMMRLTPGGPFDLERNLPPEVEKAILEAYNLDQPLHRQYLDYVGGILVGDFGPSFRYQDFTVTELIASGLPISLQLGGIAILIAAIAGVSIGTFAALRQNKLGDHIAMTMAMTGIVMPTLVIAPLLSLVFGIYLGWLPVASWGDGGIRHMILPITALALPYIAYISRLTRASMIEVLRTNYIRTARAKGLPRGHIIRKHALKAGLLPVVSFLGPATAGIVTGSIVVEQIFDLPGLGRYFVQAALNRDYTLVMGTVIFYASLLITLNLVVDLLYGVLDPRVRYRK